MFQPDKNGIERKFKTILVFAGLPQSFFYRFCKARKLGRIELVGKAVCVGYRILMPRGITGLRFREYQ